MPKLTIKELHLKLRHCEKMYEYQVNVNIDLKKKYQQLAARLKDVLKRMQDDKEKENVNVKTTH